MFKKTKQFVLKQLFYFKLTSLITGRVILKITSNQSCNESTFSRVRVKSESCMSRVESKSESYWAGLESESSRFRVRVQVFVARVRIRVPSSGNFPALVHGIFHNIINNIFDLYNTLASFYSLLIIYSKRTMHDVRYRFRFSKFC